MNLEFKTTYFSFCGSRVQVQLKLRLSQATVKVSSEAGPFPYFCCRIHFLAALELMAVCFKACRRNLISEKVLSLLLKDSYD